jgi:hypothetical protein
MKTYWPALLLFLHCLLCEMPFTSNTEENKPGWPPIPSPGNAAQQLAARVFPLFSELAADPVFAAAIREDGLLARLRQTYNSRVANGLDTCTSAYTLAQALKWRAGEIDSVRSQLLTLLDKKAHGSGFTERLRKSRACIAYNSSDGKTLLAQAWLDAAQGMNRIYDVYMAGITPHYASIDSIRIDLRSKSGFGKLRDTIRQALVSYENDRAFYTLPVALAIGALQLSGRDEAIRYEPIIAGINKEAYERVSRVRFSEYPYSAILVPGFGPEEPGLNIDPRSIKRCAMAVEQFRQKRAPFIIVSGGHVYPAGTPFSEAVEMKKYLIAHGAIPPEAIITEPYARHTTTNVRNASRLVYLFGLPVNKPVLVCTDSVQTHMVVNQAARCKRELGYLPFSKVVQLGTTTSSFYPVASAFQVNANDPLDP